MSPPTLISGGTSSSVVSDEHDGLIGKTLDNRFRITQLIGKGAMGRVYRAVQLPLNRAVALKVLDSNLGVGREEAFRQRFLVEAAMTAKLTHPNTVRVLDYGCSADGIYYLAMEYLDGETLDRLLARGPLSWRRVLGIGQQIARALREAHSLGVVHRDLKPANIMMLHADDDTDHAKVLDFGLVKSFVEGQELEGRAITKQGMLMGSPPYMAPEQGERNRADPRSDIYSLGIVLYEALTGAPPFQGTQPLAVIMQHLNAPVPELTTPEGLETIPENMKAVVLKCLAKSPMDRFDSMDEMLQALSELAAPIPTPAVDQPISQVVVTPPQRPVLMVVAFVLALIFGAAVTGAIFFTRGPRVEVIEVPVPQKPTETQVPTQVVFHLETEPPGAHVLLGTRELGVTPTDIELPADAQGRASAELTLQLAGYAPMTITAAGTGPRIELSQKLQRVVQKPVEPQPPAVEKPLTFEDVKPKTPVKPGKKKPKPAGKLGDDEDPFAPHPGSKDELKRPTAP